MASRPKRTTLSVRNDANKPMALTGVITKIEWTNPHSFIYLDVNDYKGNVANWKLEG